MRAVPRNDQHDVGPRLARSAAGIRFDHQWEVELGEVGARVDDAVQQVSVRCGLPCFVPSAVGTCPSIRRQERERCSEQWFGFAEISGWLELRESVAHLDSAEAHRSKGLVHLGEDLSLSRVAWRDALGALRVDVRLPEHFARRVLIMGPTEQAAILHGRRTSKRVRFTVLQREETTRSAALPLLIDESAPATVPLPDLSHDLERDMARSRLEWSPRTRTRLARAEPALGFALDELVQRPLQQRREIAARNRVAQQLSSSFDLGVEFGARGELN